MENTQNKELCQIRVVFPAETDEQAIAYKKKIAALLADIPEATISFSLMNAPKKPMAAGMG